MIIRRAILVHVSLAINETVVWQGAVAKLARRFFRLGRKTGLGRPKNSLRSTKTRPHFGAGIRPHFEDGKRPRETDFVLGGRIPVPKLGPENGPDLGPGFGSAGPDSVPKTGPGSGPDLGLDFGPAEPESGPQAKPDSGSDVEPELAPAAPKIIQNLFEKAPLRHDAFGKR